MNEITLAVVDGHPTTTSNQIAEHFGKRHDNVMRDITRLECSPEFRRLNFEETVETRVNPSGGAPIESRAYRLTRDGFTFLCMGFTGRDAAAWKERYIAAFNAMEAELRKVGAGETATVAQSYQFAAALLPQLAEAIQSGLDSRHRRWFLAFTHDGKPYVQTIPKDAFVMTLPQLLKAINEPGSYPIDTAMLADFIVSSTRRLQQRCEFYQQKEQKAKTQRRALQ